MLGIGHFYFALTTCQSTLTVLPSSAIVMPMIKYFFLLAVLNGMLSAQLATGPQLPMKVVDNWAKLPKGWNLGETSGVAVDKLDHVWVFNRGTHPVIEFDRDGNMLQAWNDVPIISSHGIQIDPDGNVWLVDVKGHAVMKFTREGRLLMVIANAGKAVGDNTSTDAFNQPTGLRFFPNGDFLVSDGYGNSRVAKFGKDGVWQKQWGEKGTGDGQFNLVHDVALDGKGKVYVADRNNNRIQVFTEEGKFLSKWTNLGSPWGLAFSTRENVLYMCDGVNNRVIKVDLDGKLLGVLGGFGKLPGLFDFPHHMAVDSQGSIYVAEIKNWRISKFVQAK